MFLHTKQQFNKYPAYPVLLVSQALEDLHHGVSDGLDHFMVMVIKGHLNIQTHKLSQVTVSVGVLRPKN